MRILYRLLLLALLSTCMQTPVTSPDGSVDSFDALDGSDPHRWLESLATDPRVSTWLAQQAAMTRDWQQQQPSYQQIRDDLLAAWDHPKWMVADIKRGQVFFYYNQGLADHYSLYRQPYAAFVDERSAAARRVTAHRS